MNQQEINENELEKVSGGYGLDIEDPSMKEPGLGIPGTEDPGISLPSIEDPGGSYTSVTTYTTTTSSN